MARGNSTRADRRGVDRQSVCLELGRQVRGTNGYHVSGRYGVWRTASDTGSIRRAERRPGGGRSPTTNAGYSWTSGPGAGRVAWNEDRLEYQRTTGCGVCVCAAGCFAWSAANTIYRAIPSPAAAGEVLRHPMRRKRRERQRRQTEAKKFRARPSHRASSTAEERTAAKTTRRKANRGESRTRARDGTSTTNIRPSYQTRKRGAIYADRYMATMNLPAKMD